MASNSKTKSDAEVRFAKAQKRSIDAAKAMSEAEAESRRIDANTARLRALRLARDAAEEAAVASAAKPRGKKAPAKNASANTADVEARRLAGNAADAILGKKPRPARSRGAKSIPVEDLNASNDK